MGIHLIIRLWMWPHRTLVPKFVLFICLCILILYFRFQNALFCSTNGGLYYNPSWIWQENDPLIFDALVWLFVIVLYSGVGGGGGLFLFLFLFFFYFITRPCGWTSWESSRPGFNSCFHFRSFSRSSHTNDFEIGTQVSSKTEVTTSMGGLENGHIRKNLTQKKRKKERKVNPKDM